MEKGNKKSEIGHGGGKCLPIDPVLFVSGTVQAPQLIGEVPDKVHRQRVIGSLGQLHFVFGAETDDEEFLLLVVVYPVDHQQLVGRSVQHLGGKFRQSK